MSSTSELKSALKGNETRTKIPTTNKKIQFRIFVGSYEHNLLCLSTIIDPLGESESIFQPIFHFQAHSLSIKSIDLAKRYLVTGSNDEHIRIYDLQKRKELGTLLSHQGTITTLKFSNELNASGSVEKSGKWLLSGSEDGKIIIWRTKDWEVFGTLKGHTSKINDIAIHPSGKVAISVSQDQTIRLWNLMTAKKAAILKIKGKDHLGQSGEFVKWSNDGKYFIVGLLNQLLIYKTSSAKIVKKIKFKKTLMCMDVLKFENENWLCSGLNNGSMEFFKFDEQILKDISDDEDRIWNSDPVEIEPNFKLIGHTNRIKGISFFQNDEETQGIPTLVSISSDGKVVVWNLNLKDQIAVYDTGERLNCVITSSENIEKIDTMKKRILDERQDYSESEYETDGEEIKKIMNKSKKKKGKKNKKRKVNITLE
ncbi:unnamed protein product [Candida verbasci]|uniref:Maintenance of killer 11 protein n=1 Tax=Candida verbasci TaxID=1227364 RepID=A0A9W4TZK9_9ASCO|nr:unnamed protein product [Candida verbasci]